MPGRRRWREHVHGAEHLARRSSTPRPNIAKRHRGAEGRAASPTPRSRFAKVLKSLRSDANIQFPRRPRRRRSQRPQGRRRNITRERSRSDGKLVDAQQRAGDHLRQARRPAKAEAALAEAEESSKDECAATCEQAAADRRKRSRRSKRRSPRTPQARLETRAGAAVRQRRSRRPRLSRGGRADQRAPL